MSFLFVHMFIKIVLWLNILPYVFALFFFAQGGLKLSAPQPNNLTIQRFVESYVDKYIGEFTVYYHPILVFCAQI